MSPAVLQEVRLSEVYVDIAPNTDAVEHLVMVIQVDHLSFANLDGGFVVVTAEIALSLVVGDEGALPEELHEESEVIAGLSATFRLTYQAAPIHEGEMQRVFAARRALQDVWPIWRMWLHQTLALAGLAPTPLPAHISAQLIKNGEDAFEATRKRQEAQEE